MTVKETDERADVDAILAAVTPRTKIVFLANPNNPTGTYLPFQEVRRLHAALPGNVLLVLDAAYAEYVRRNDYEAGIELAGSAQNVVMTRTFSKLGLGGARIGWMYGPLHIVDAINRIRGPFNVNATAIEAGIAAIRDRAHVERSVVHNETWLTWLNEELTKLGLRVTPSVGNFVLIHFPQDKKHSAEAADDYLTAARLYLAARYRLWLSQRAAHERRHRGSQSRRHRRPHDIPEKLKHMTSPMFEKIALVGIGLIGSSLARVIRREGLARHVAIATRSPTTLARAKELGLGEVLHHRRQRSGSRCRPGHRLGAGRLVGRGGAKKSRRR